MNLKGLFTTAVCTGLMFTSCVSKKEFLSLQAQLSSANQDVAKCGTSLSESLRKISALEQEIIRLKGEVNTADKSTTIRQEQLNDLKAQLADCKAQRDKQATQVGSLTVLSQSASDNIKETLGQLEKKDKYIHLLQAAKTKADSINLALAVNLKGVLSEGLADKDVEIKVDKTVVFINLSDKMLFQSGSYTITPKAKDVLGKIAKIVESRPEVEVMVEGYTDNVPMKNACVDDNWDLSVKRSTAVVRILQKGYNIDPNRLVAAGRGEYNALTSNDTPEGKSTNRRTRIIILPKLDQFYELLNPNNAPK
jgi:chemotaxis protein MotB